MNVDEHPLTTSRALVPLGRVTRRLPMRRTGLRRFEPGSPAVRTALAVGGAAGLLLLEPVLAPLGKRSLRAVRSTLSRPASPTQAPEPSGRSGPALVMLERFRVQVTPSGVDGVREVRVWRGEGE